MISAVALKDPYLESRIFGARMVVVVGLLLLLLGVLLARYFSLKIIEYDTYRTASERNRVQLQSIAPKRGLVFDRNGILLAENRPSYVLSLVVERVPDIDHTLELLAEMVTLSAADLEKFSLRSKRRSEIQGQCRLTNATLVVKDADSSRISSRQLL